MEALYCAAMSASDFELLDSWRGGDTRSGQELFTRYFDSLCSFFATKCFADADELVQRTMLAATRGKEQFRKEASFRTYLYTLARNELYHYLQQKRRDGVLDFSITSVADIVTTPATRLARDADRHKLLEMLRTLPIEQQTLLELHYWEELDADALAEVFDTTTGAIRVRLHRARQVLKERLGDEEAMTKPVRT